MKLSEAAQVYLAEELKKIELKESERADEIAEMMQRLKKEVALVEGEADF